MGAREMKIEGNSFLEYIEADLAVMCARAEGGKVKPSARRALAKTDLLYLSSLNADDLTARKQFAHFLARLPLDLNVQGLPIFTHADIRRVVSQIPLGHLDGRRLQSGLSQMIGRVQSG